MSDHREFPLSSRNDSATPEPGVRAARERTRPKLTQEQVAERMNVSIHTFRRWDQDRNRPSRPEQMQLLAAVLGTRIDVIWPATDDPLVAEALRLEHQRAALEGGGPARQRSATSPSVPEAGTPETQVRRLEKTPAGPCRDVERNRTSSVAFEIGSGAEGDGPADDPGGLPPWPDDVDGEPQDDRLGVEAGQTSTLRETSALEAHRSSMQAPTPEPVGAGHGDAVTLRAKRPVPGRRVQRVVVALAAALVIGGVGMIVASALGERPADADPSSRTVPARAVERERVEVGARGVAEAAAERGDYDAAIAAARSLGDMKALERYQQAAVNVLVRRADVAAGRGDLGLARQRLRRAAQRYGATPAAGDVEAHIRRIQRARAERADRRREVARKRARQAQTTSAAPVSPENAASPTTTESSDAAASSTNDSSSASSSTPESSDAESGSSEDTCSDGCGLGSFPSAGQEEGQKR